MSGPERIWAIGNGKGGDWGTRNGLCHTFGGTEYIRADAVAEMIRQAVEAERDALRAKLDEAVEGLESIIACSTCGPSRASARATIAKIKGADHE